MVNPGLPEIVCGVHPQICFIIFLILHGFILLFLIINVSLPQWLHQGQGDTEWYGNLSEIYDGNGSFTQDTYIEVGNNFCDLADKSFGIDEDIYELLCGRFRALDAAGGILVTGIVLCIVCYIVVILGLILTWISTSCIILTEVFNSIGASIFTIFATIYLGLSYANNEDDCDEIYTEDRDDDGTITITLEPACRDSGGNFLIFLTLVVPVISILLCVFGCCCLPSGMKRAFMQPGFQMQPVQGVAVGTVQQAAYPPNQMHPQIPAPLMQPGYPPQQYPPYGYEQPSMPYPAPPSYPPAPVGQAPYTGQPPYGGVDPSQGLYPTTGLPGQPMPPQGQHQEGKQF